MAFTAATLQTSIETGLAALTLARNELELYRDNCNNPGRLAQCNTALNAAVTAIALVQA